MTRAPRRPGTVAALALLALGLTLALAPSGMGQDGDLSLDPAIQERAAEPGGAVRFTFQLSNDGLRERHAELDHTPEQPNTTVELTPRNVTLAPGETVNVTLEVDVAAHAGHPAWYNHTIIARSRSTATSGFANATAALNVRQLHPDATPTQLATTPSQPSAGDSVRLDATVENRGDEVIDALTVRFSVDADGLGERTVTGLAPGATVTVHGPRWNATAGPHTLAVHADPEDALEEDDEQDNVLERDLRVPDDDAQATWDPSAADATSAPGGRAHLELRLAHDGETTGSYELGLEGTPAGWTPHLDPEHVDLAPGESATVNVTLELPDDATRGSQHRMTLTAESRDATATASLTVAVETANEPREDDGTTPPQAALQGLTAHPRAPSTNDPVAVQAQVRNEDARTASNLTLRLTLDGSQTAMVELEPLPPGTNRSVRLAERTLDAGRHTVTASLSADGTQLATVTTSIKVLEPASAVQLTLAPARVPTPPGGTAAIEVTLDDDQARLRTGRLVALVPDGWARPAPVSIELPAQTPARAVVNVTVPEDATPGVDAEVRIVAELDGQRVAAETALVPVLPTTPLEITLEPDGPAPGPGETVPYRATVHNPTDRERWTPLTLDGLPGGWTASLSRQQLHLAPGETATVRVDVTAPLDGPSEEGAELTVRSDAGTPAETTGTLTVQAADASAGTAPGVWAAIGGVGVVGLAAAWLHEPTRYRLIPLLGPLYTRLSKDEVLDHELRQRIYEHVRANPGVHYTGIKDALDLANGTLTHHLRVLEGQGLVTSRRDGRRKRFYTSEGAAPDGPTGLRGRILMIVTARPGLSQADLADELGTSRQLVNYHVQALQENGQLRLERDGRASRLHPAGTRFVVDEEG